MISWNLRRPAAEGQQSTGLLHLDGFESYVTSKKPHPAGVVLLLVDDADERIPRCKSGYAIDDLDDNGISAKSAII